MQSLPYIFLDASIGIQTRSQKLNFHFSIEEHMIINHQSRNMNKNIKYSINEKPILIFSYCIFQPYMI